jgi:hypothetical protein
MIDRRFGMLAAAMLSLGFAGKVFAGECCAVALPAVTEEIYLVNQGPTFTGPGHALPRQLPDLAPPVGAYPYVGYVYSGYPYGLQSSGGYPRGFYSPFTGYPYVDPSPRIALYTKYRQSLGYYRRHYR